jgi:4-hydroxy-tetrahydrodipicolinate synthase
MNNITTKKISGVWSASPTPFTEDYKIDEESLERLITHHHRLGINGLFLAGTCGEGPWLDNSQLCTLLKSTIKHNQGKMLISVQVTDCSSMQMLENIKLSAGLGADIAVIARPGFPMQTSQKYLCDMLLEVIDKSPLPIGFYHRGRDASGYVEEESLIKIIEHPNTLLLKDSSCDLASQGTILGARDSKLKNTFFALNGNEFECLQYLEAGYDGLLLGGACFNGYMAQKIIEAVNAGDLETAQSLQERMNRMMYDVFGGENISCWLAGQKQLMVELGIFSNNKTIIDYSLTPECHRAIREVVKREKDYLLPQINKKIY